MTDCMTIDFEELEFVGVLGGAFMMLAVVLYMRRLRRLALCLCDGLRCVSKPCIQHDAFTRFKLCVYARHYILLKLL